MKKNKGTVPNIYMNQLPEDIQEGISKNGFTLHKNVMIVWNEKDKTDDVLKFIDGFSEDVRKELLIVSNQGGLVDLVWNDRTPSSFQLFNVRIGKKLFPVSSYPYFLKR